MVGLVILDAATSEGGDGSCSTFVRQAVPHVSSLKLAKKKSWGDKNTPSPKNR